MVVRGIHHLGVAVHDLDAGLDTYTRMLGAKLEHRETVPDQGVEAAAMLLGGGRVELLAALGADTPVGRFLAKRGEGLHHVAYEVDDVSVALGDLARKGAHLIDELPRHGAFGLEVGFTQAAVVLAVTFVASPFYLRAAIAAFEAIDPNLPAAARTLGAGPARTFFRIALPLAAGGLGAGWALAFARGIGEFGATILFAGSLQGVTQTLSLAIYEQFDVNFDVALAVGAELVVVSAAVLLLVKVVPWTRSPSTSFIPFAPSRSR